MPPATSAMSTAARATATGRAGLSCDSRIVFSLPVGCAARGRGSGRKEVRGAARGDARPQAARVKEGRPAPVRDPQHARRPKLSRDDPRRADPPRRREEAGVRPQTRRSRRGSGARGRARTWARLPRSTGVPRRGGSARGALWSTRSRAATARAATRIERDAGPRRRPDARTTATSPATSSATQRATANGRYEKYPCPDRPAASERS